MLFRPVKVTCNKPLYGRHRHAIIFVRMYQKSTISLIRIELTDRDPFRKLNYLLYHYLTCVNCRFRVKSLICRIKVSLVSGHFSLIINILMILPLLISSSGFLYFSVVSYKFIYLPFDFIFFIRASIESMQVVI